MCNLYSITTNQAAIIAVFRQPLRAITCMIELLIGAIALLSVGIFLAHAVAAYLAE
jgi:hypothetical protein